MNQWTSRTIVRSTRQTLRGYLECQRTARLHGMPPTTPNYYYYDYYTILLLLLLLLLLHYYYTRA